MRGEMISTDEKSDQIDALLLSGERFLLAGLVSFTLGVFFGSKFIVTGQVLGLVAVVLFVIDSFEGHKKKLFAWSQYRSSSHFLIGLVLFSLISVLANGELIDNSLQHIKKLRYHLLFILLLGIPTVRQWREGRANWPRVIILAWITSVLISSSVGMYASITGYNPILMKAPLAPSRLSGFFTQSMTFGNNMQFSFLLLAAMTISVVLKGARFSVPLWLLIVTSFITGLGVYLSGSRGAVLGCIAGLVTLAFLSSRKLVVIVFFVVIAGGVYSYANGSRLLTNDFFEKGGSIQVRVAQWKTAGLVFLENPGFGIGYRNMERHCAAFKKKYNLPKDSYRKVGVPDDVSNKKWYWFNAHAHNNYLEAFASTGIFGGLAFVGFCVFWFYELHRSSQTKLIFMPVVCAFFVSGFFENTFTDSEVLNFILLIYFASQIALDWEEQKQKEIQATTLA